MKALEIDVEELQELAESTGDRGHIGALKAKKSALADRLGISAQGALVRSRFRNISEMDASSRFFFGLERKIQVEQESSAELEADVSLDELHTALQSMENGKAPGIDGLPVEFIRPCGQ
ncbi:hypothetical protein NHX12_024093 [Muraenolepis orangiensis]|uniref:Uncharacterized protein n=1 Tax=Muraenolepis orangiensis TaxID=630683 RepID=A0A9Q0EQ52_9TELE|nr:hypothetical protein NHX12_024093 [Muraenolepis orangiensis]